MTLRHLPHTTRNYNGERGLVPVGGGQRWTWQQCSILLHVLATSWPDHPWVAR